MEIIKLSSFSDELDTVLDFIALDNIHQALKFANDLEIKISDIPFMPYKCRKSLYFNEEDIRDLIFKGYTIPYFIDKENDRIFVLGILKYKSDFEINGTQ